MPEGTARGAGRGLFHFISFDYLPLLGIPGERLGVGGGGVLYRPFTTLLFTQKTQFLAKCFLD